MKIKKKILVLVLVGTVSAVTFFIGRQIGLNTDSSSISTIIEEKQVEIRNITKTLTSSGEIQTASTEKIFLTTTKYFETMCVEKDDMVMEGENILKYADGTYLVAPYDCLVSSYSVPTSGSICASSNYIEISNLKNLQISLSINENEISNISVGMEVIITLTADTSKTYTGKVSKISSVGNYQSSGSTFEVNVSFENDGNAKIGMSVSCEINIAELKDVIAVPINAVQENKNKKYVIVLENGEEKETEIQTGLADDKYVQVISGLEGEETIKVVTTTKQNTIRNSNSSNSKEKNGMQGGFSGGQNGQGGMQKRSGGTTSDMGNMPERSGSR